jgi:hypothetical protein
MRRRIPDLSEIESGSAKTLEHAARKGRGHGKITTRCCLRLRVNILLLRR